MVTITIDTDNCTAPVACNNQPCTKFVKAFEKEHWSEDDYPSLKFYEVDHQKGLNPIVQVEELTEDGYKVKELVNGEVKYTRIYENGDVKLILGNSEVKFKGRVVIC